MSNGADRMPIPDETIEKWERDYDVDITYDPDKGTFSVESLKSGDDLWMQHTSYRVSGRILDETITPHADYAEALGVELTDNPHDDFGTMNAKLFEKNNGVEVLEKWRPNFTDSHLHRVSVVSGALRTDGQIPPEAWARDLSLGGAGSGAAILPGGGQGGVLSPIGIQHDIDMFLGGHGYGPMAELANVVSDTKVIPSGLHGLGGLLQTIEHYRGSESSGRLRNEQENFPATREFPDYVGRELNEAVWRGPPDGWKVETPEFQLTPGSRKLGPDGPNPVKRFLLSTDGINEVVSSVESFIEQGGDPQQAMNILRQSEDQSRGEEQVNTLDSPTASVDDYSQNHEDDYGIV